MTYNDTIIFCVPREFVMRAVGEEGRNIKRLSEILQKKIRVIPSPSGIQNARQFIENIVKPVMFKDLEVRGREMILTAGSQSKASLIGRNKRRFSMNCLAFCIPFGLGITLIFFLRISLILLILLAPGPIALITIGFGTQKTIVSL